MKLANYAFLLIIIFTQNIIAQKPAKKSDIPIEVKANVLVLDSKDELINDIKQEDIKIFEDGVEQKLTYFSKKEPTLNLGLVFDNTGSLRDKLKEIVTAGKIIVANLRDTDQAFVVRFVSSDVIEVVQETTNDKRNLTLAIDNLYIEGGQSAVLDAVYLSAEKLLKLENQDKSKRYAIILFSDAEDRDSYYKLDEVMKMFKGTDLQVFVLSYALFAPNQKDKAVKLSHIITQQTGGTLYTLARKHSKEDAMTFLAAITYELRSQYIIGYTSTNQFLDGNPRKLTVQIADNEKGEKRVGIIREGFTVPKK